MIDKMIVEILDKHRADIPDEINVQPFIKYPLTMSLSFPNVPHLFSDRVEMPFDGTIYLTSEGYHPFADPAPPMPSFNAGNPNKQKTMFKIFFKYYFIFIIQLKFYLLACHNKAFECLFYFMLRSVEN